MHRRIYGTLRPFLITSPSVYQYHSGGIGRTLLGIQASVHIHHAFHIVVVVEVSEERLHIVYGSILRILHVSTDNDNRLAVVLHACESIERYLWIKTAY